MKIKIRNKFTAILLAIAMLFAGFFTFGGMKTKTAKADMGTTYSGIYIDDIAANFISEALCHFGVCEDTWILFDDQILGANGAWESLLATIVDIMELTPASDNDSDRLLAIGEAGVNLIKIGDDATYEITGQGLSALWQEINNGSSAPHVCGIGIWQFNIGAYNEFDSLQSTLLQEPYEILMPIYVIEREQIEISEFGTLCLWVYDDAHGGGFWGTWEGRP